jgi:hypothetical protein
MHLRPLLFFPKENWKPTEEIGKQLEDPFMSPFSSIHSFINTINHDTSRNTSIRYPRGRKMAGCISDSPRPTTKHNATPHS